MTQRRRKGLSTLGFLAWVMASIAVSLVVLDCTSTSVYIPTPTITPMEEPTWTPTDIPPSLVPPTATATATPLPTPSPVAVETPSAIPTIVEVTPVVIIVTATPTPSPTPVPLAEYGFTDDEIAVIEAARAFYAYCEEQGTRFDTERSVSERGSLEPNQNANTLPSPERFLPDICPAWYWITISVEVDEDAKYRFTYAYKWGVSERR